MVSRSNEVATFLPYPIAKSFNLKNIIARKIEQPAPWIATLCRIQKNEYTPLENKVFLSLLEAFKKQKN